MKKQTKGIPPLRAIRMNCLVCCLNSALEVRLCPSTECALYPYRFGRLPKSMESGNCSPLKSIRAKCLDCHCGSPGEVRRCEIKDCPLWYFRLGKNPNRKPSDAQLEHLREIRQKSPVSSNKPHAQQAKLKQTIIV